MSTETKPYFVTLKNRGLVHVSGPDAAAFLQNLVTNDMTLLERQPVLYACLLTPKGLFLHDFFITKEEGGYRLETEGGARAEDLARRLSFYKLRSNVTLACEKEVSVYATMEPVESSYPDPRHAEMGFRSLKKPGGVEEKSFDSWEYLRLSFGIPDGSRDMIPERSNMIESRIDSFNGLSFSKGCYLGQELTARLHLRGACKRHLYPVEADDPVPEVGTEIHINGKPAGEMRSSRGNLGLALLQDEAAASMNAGPVRVRPLSADAG